MSVELKSRATLGVTPGESRVLVGGMPKKSEEIKRIVRESFASDFAREDSATLLSIGYSTDVD